LTEEARLLRHFEARILDLCDAATAPHRARGVVLPIELKATAVCFLKRFYLHASMMEHDPRLIMITCISLACKSEDCQLFPTLEDLLAAPAVRDLLSGIKIETALTLVQESELLLLQGTRFHLMLHHPYRPLKGWLASVKEFNPALLKDGALEARAQACLNRSLHTDAVFTHAPSRVGLAALVAAGDQEGIDLDEFLKKKLGSQAGMAPNSLLALTQELRHIARIFFGEISAPTMDDLQRDSLWKRASLIWSRKLNKGANKESAPLTKKRNASAAVPQPNIGSTKKAKMVSFMVRKDDLSAAPKAQ